MVPAFISTDAVEPRLRAEYWREAARPLHVVSPAEGSHELSGSVHAHLFSSIEIWTTTFNAQQYLRTQRTIAQARSDCYLVNVTLAGGSVGDFNGTSIVVHTGDVHIVDLAQPYHSRVQMGQRIVLLVPRELLEKLIGKKNLHGVVLKAGQPMTTLLTDYLIGLRTFATQLSDTETAGALDALFPMLAGAFAGKGTDYIGASVVSSLALRQRVLAFIDERITHPDLGPEKLMQHFHVSRAHLYRMFEIDGGIARLIREKRLDLAYQLLTTPAPDRHSRSIKELAYACGFANSEQFRRAFKARFGATPQVVQTEPLMPIASLGKSSFYEFYREFAAAMAGQ